MDWVLVPPLAEGRDQFNERFPNRDKTTDGSIGNRAHATSTSSHNPDLTGNPEFRDGDSKDEVRALDVDKDLRDPDGVTMEDVVQLFVRLARSGVLWWIRYIIFNGRIWHRRDGFTTREYTGSNNHSGHVHINSDFTQKSDNATGTNWHLDYLKRKTPQKTSSKRLLPDGKLGPRTIHRWQEVMGTPVDGKIDRYNSALVFAVQRRLRKTVAPRLSVDGEGIRQDGRRYKTIGALQKYLGVPVDEFLSVPVSRTVKALQDRLNQNRF